MQIRILLLSILISSICSLKELPKHILTGYWENWDSPDQLRLHEIPLGFNVVIIGFSDNLGSGNIGFTIQQSSYSIDQFKNDVKLLNSRGQAVILSIGGASIPWTLSSATEADNFAKSAFSIMTEWGFDGIDIDIENEFNPSYLITALKKLSLLKPGYRLFMAPGTHNVQENSSAVYLKMIKELKDIITVVNTQYYNSFPQYGFDGKIYTQGTIDFFTALADILIAGSYLDASQVGLGVVLTPSEIGDTGQLSSPQIAIDAFTCLKQGKNCGSYKPRGKYENIRGLMTWDINWDKRKSFRFVNAVKDVLATNNDPLSTTISSLMPTISSIPTPCGRGKIGNRKCLQRGYCCSKWFISINERGYCGKGINYCKSSSCVGGPCHKKNCGKRENCFL